MKESNLQYFQGSQQAFVFTFVSSEQLYWGKSIASMGSRAGPFGA
jgi:hypothetical protein